MYVRGDANTITEGLVDENNLGCIDDFDSLIGVETYIKEGSTVFEGEKTVIAHENMWGRIFQEEEDRYLIIFPGAWIVEVHKSDVGFLE